MVGKFRKYQSLFIIIMIPIIIVFWEYIKSVSIFLNEKFDSEFLISSTSLIISLLIPIAITLLDSKQSDNSNENRWTQKVLKKQIIHFKDILNYVIIIFALLIISQLFPQLTLFTIGIFLMSIYYLIRLIHKYIEWIDIDGLGNDLAIKEQEALLTSPKYSLNEQVFYWQLFIDYACSQNKNSSLFNPNIFYNVWEKAANNYKDQSSYQFYGFYNLLASNIPNLKLNYNSAFDEVFYRHCIEHSIKEVNSKRNWRILTDVLTSCVQKDASKDDESFTYYRAVNTLDGLVNDNLANIKALNYINRQFINCLLSCEYPYSKELDKTNFQIRSKYFSDKNSDSFYQTISLMQQLIQCARRHKYHSSMDTSINMLFPRADGITIGRLDYLIECIWNSFNSYGANQNLAISVLDIVNGIPKFGRISTFPNEETDISNLDNNELKKIREESYLESIKIYAYFYKKCGWNNSFKNYLKRVINIMESDSYIKLLKEKQNAQYLNDISRVYRNILTDFLKYLSY